MNPFPSPKADGYAACTGACRRPEIQFAFLQQYERQIRQWHRRLEHQPRYFVEGLIGLYNGTTLNYTQWSTVFGYRFGGLRK